MGATAALRFARHATANGAVVALVPQVALGDFEYSGRADFPAALKQELRYRIEWACLTAAATVHVHVGLDPPDLRQLDYLPPRHDGALRVTRHQVEGHALGAGLHAIGALRPTLLRDLLGLDGGAAAPAASARRALPPPPPAAALAVDPDAEASALT